MKRSTFTVPKHSNQGIFDFEENKTKHGHITLISNNLNNLNSNNLKFME